MNTLFINRFIAVKCDRPYYFSRGSEPQTSNFTGWMWLWKRATGVLDEIGEERTEGRVKGRCEVDGWEKGIVLAFDCLYLNKKKNLTFSMVDSPWYGERAVGSGCPLPTPHPSAPAARQSSCLRRFANFPVPLCWKSVSTPDISSTFYHIITCQGQQKVKVVVAYIFNSHSCILRVILVLMKYYLCLLGFFKVWRISLRVQRSLNTGAVHLCKNLEIQPTVPQITINFTRCESFISNIQAHMLLAIIQCIIL